MGESLVGFSFFCTFEKNNIHMKPDIFKPSDKKEYQELWRYGEAIQEGFWLHSHFTYDRDVRDFNIQLSNYERGVVTRCMQAVAIVENRGPKPFWAGLYQRMPHDVIADVGFVFSANEVVHKNTYEALPNLLGIDVSKDTIESIPCMRDRIKYLTKYLEGVRSRSDKEFTKSLILFTLLVENTSLFNMFLIMNSFNKYRNVLANFNSVTSIVSKEEILHGTAGAHLVSIIREENPEWFDDEMEAKIRRNVRKAYKAEMGVLDWILGEGELEFLPKDTIIEFLKSRFNDSLNQLGYGDEYEVDTVLLEPAKFFELDLKSTAGIDFFNQKVTDYSIKEKVTEDDWDF